MSWLTSRSAIQAICWVSIFFLLGLGHMVGIKSITDSLGSSGITMAQVIAVGLGYILFSFWQRYI